MWKTLKDEAEKFMVANVQDSYSSDLQVKLVECRHAFDRLSTEAVDKGMFNICCSSLLHYL